MRVDRSIMSSIAAAATICLSLFPAAGSADERAWRAWGPNNQNTRYAASERDIRVNNASQLTQNWRVDLHGDLAATPVVEGNAVYMTDLGGFLTRLDRKTGATVWSVPISTYTGVADDLARVSPALSGDLLILGDQGGRLGQGARMMAVNKKSGALVWVKQVDQHPAALITQSATVHGNTVFVGVSSAEETYAVGVPGYECCSFRGSMLALNARTGALLWQTPTIDDAAYAKGYRGNAIWGSQPTVDPARGLVYAATGNNYDIPPSVSECVSQALATAPEDETAVRACLANDQNYFDAVVAFDLKSGKVRWWNAVLPFDAFTIACVFMPDVYGDNCPSPAGPDHDFGQAPMLYRPNGKHSKELLGIGQKSGMFWALNPDDGTIVWKTKVGPGGHVGGAMWGSATDSDLVYVTEANYNRVDWILQGHGAQAGTTVNRGFWSALDARTGEIVWQTADPNADSTVMAPLTIAGDVLFGASMAGAPTAKNMFALNPSNGEILWGFASGGSVIGGASVVDGVVFWGSGYTGGELALGTSNHQLYSFSIPKKPKQ